MLDLTKIIIYFFILLISSITIAEETLPFKKVTWPFQGVLGSVDRKAAQRGFQVYREVCAACHGLYNLYYRNLKELGFSDEEIKEIAKNYTIQDGPNDLGEMFERPALPADPFVRPYPNEQAARAANNGAYPPDLSLIIKARPDGANYLYSLLTGYAEPPEHFKLMPGLHYNPYFPGNQLAMPPPLSDGQVNYMDGTASSVEQMAMDVAIFLQWAAEPEMENRKSMGLKVMMFLVIFTILLTISKNVDDLPVLVNLILNKLRSYDPNYDQAKVKKAINWAIWYYRGQSAYPLELAQIIIAMQLDSNALITALLHSILKETKLPLKKVEHHFSIEIVHLLNGVKSLDQISYSPYENQGEKFSRLLLSLSEDIRTQAVLIKLSYLLHKVSIFDSRPLFSKCQLITSEIIEIYTPILAQMTIDGIKNVLQDLYFKISKPDVREHILTYLQTFYPNKEQLVNKTIKILHKNLTTASIEAKISGRLKSPYSIWLKMLKKNVKVKQLYDILAFRIIVDDIDQCYKTLNIIHQQYQALLGQFHDYIRDPKPNGYKSLHTVVIGPTKQIIEIQIRTKAMHEVAQYGIAAHWQYKRKPISIKEKIHNLYQLSCPIVYLPLTSMIRIQDPDRLQPTQTLYKSDPSKELSPPVMHNRVLLNSTNNRTSLNSSSTEQNWRVDIIIGPKQLYNESSKSVIQNTRKAPRIELQLIKFHLNNKINLSFDHNFQLNDQNTNIHSTSHNNIIVVSDPPVKGEYAKSRVKNITPLLTRKPPLKNIQSPPTPVVTSFSEPASNKENSNHLKQKEPYHAAIVEKLQQEAIVINDKELRTKVRKPTKIKLPIDIPCMKIKKIDEHDDNSPLIQAILYEDVDATEQLLACEEVDLNTTSSPILIASFLKDGESPFLLSVRKGNIEIVQAFLQLPQLNINEINQDEETALIIAASVGNKEIFKLLINYLQDIFKNDIVGLKEYINCVDTSNHSALYYVIERHLMLDEDISEIIQILLKLKDQEGQYLVEEFQTINATDENGDTKFSIAVQEAEIVRLKELLMLKDEDGNYLANINTINCEGYTPFMLALLPDNYNIEIILFLLSIRSPNGKPTVEIGNYEQSILSRFFLTEIYTGNIDTTQQLLVAMREYGLPLLNIPSIYQDDNTLINVIQELLLLILIEDNDELFNSSQEQEKLFLQRSKVINYVYQAFIQNTENIDLQNLAYELKWEENYEGLFTDYMLAKLLFAILTENMEIIAESIIILGNVCLEVYEYFLLLKNKYGLSFKEDKKITELLYNTILDNNKTPYDLLSLATEVQDCQKFEELLESGIDINCVSKEGMTIFLNAVADNKVSLIQKLLTFKDKEGNYLVDVNYVAAEGDTALLCAAQEGHVEVAKILVGLKNSEGQLIVNVNHADTESNTALVLAAQEGEIEIVKILVGLKNSEGQLIVNVNHAGTGSNTALLWAAQGGFIKPLPKLADAKPGHQTAGYLSVYEDLSTCWSHKSPEEVEFLNRFIEIVKILVELKNSEDQLIVNVNHANTEGNTALLCAAREGYIETVKILIGLKDSQGQLIVNVNHANTEGNSALSWAARKGYIEIVKILVELQDNNGRQIVDINHKDEFDKMAISYFSNDNKAKQFLREHGAREVPPQEGATYETVIKDPQSTHRKHISQEVLVMLYKLKEKFQEQNTEECISKNLIEIQDYISLLKTNTEACKRTVTFAGDNVTVTIRKANAIDTVSKKIPVADALDAADMRLKNLLQYSDLVANIDVEETLSLLWLEVKEQEQTENHEIRSSFVLDLVQSAYEYSKEQDLNNYATTSKSHTKTDCHSCALGTIHQLVQTLCHLNPVNTALEVNHLSKDKSTISEYFKQLLNDLCLTEEGKQLIEDVQQEVQDEATNDYSQFRATQQLLGIWKKNLYNLFGSNLNDTDFQTVDEIFYNSISYYDTSTLFKKEDDEGVISDKLNKIKEYIITFNRENQDIEKKSLKKHKLYSDTEIIGAEYSNSNANSSQQIEEEELYYNLIDILGDT
ncbi:Cytochrome c1-2, heme protein, mitochondrial [Pseudolycoriella hygida]|uniref:Cytochrome c1-2, heme protein, mitochondrial n=1 Tax=Pseudolycoriella hygida TaxID=35572 RepID=A0A9Q0N879_9DIPT|nr:Cytochrome c1-2, heme protein, mitochondrial [Pseudolycoriella hygida]